MNRSTIELAWFEPGSALAIAQRYPGVTRSMVCAYWKRARAQGRLPNIKRPSGGFDWEKLLELQLQSQPDNSIPPITKHAPAHADERAA